MPSVIPISHITDAHLLEADAVVELFKLVPNAGGTLYFKPGADVTWQGNTYSGLPCKLTGLKRSSENAVQQPRLQIGQPDIDLSAFKPLIHDGYVDGAVFTYYRVLLTHLQANLNISDAKVFRAKRIVSYSRSQIIIDLASSSDGMQFTIPNLQYYPPGFPAVMLDD